MSLQAWKVVKVAKRLASSNPLLAFSLERSALAVVNPDAKDFNQSLEGTVTVLKSLEEELEKALKKLDSDVDAEEFAKFFDDATEAESEELRQMLKKVSSVAGVKDFFKGLFKKKKPAEEVESGPSYKMDDSTMDEFVEGDRDWADPSHYVEQESNENKEFSSGVEKVLKDMDKVREKPSKDSVNGILKEVKKLIRHGENLMKGVRKHLLEPAPKAEITEEGMKSSKPAKKEKLSPEKLESTVTYYADLLKDTLGDESKTISLLKELFNAVGPAVQEDRASLASKRDFAVVLAKIATTHSMLQPRLMPVIRALVKS